MQEEILNEVAAHPGCGQYHYSIDATQINRSVQASWEVQLGHAGGYNNPGSYAVLHRNAQHGSEGSTRLQAHRCRCMLDDD